MHHRFLHVLGHVDHHRTGTTALGDVERFHHDARNVVRIGDQVAVLHAGQRHAVEIRLLKRAAADHRRRHLSGDRHQWTRVQIGVGDGSNQVRSPRTRGAHAHPRPAGRPRVALRSEPSSLLVPRQDGANLLRAGQRLVNRHAGASRVGEHRLDPGPLQALHQYLGTSHRFAALDCIGGIGLGLGFSFGRGRLRAHRFGRCGLVREK